MPVPFWVLLLVAFAALVIARRWVANRWEPDLRPEARRASTPAVFGRVWLQSNPPRSSLFAYRDRRTGALQTDPQNRRATFVAKDGSYMAIDDIAEVTMKGTKGHFVNAWVTVRFGEAEDLKTAYLNDAAWLGWRPLLTKANQRLAQAIAACMAPRPE